MSKHQSHRPAPPKPEPRPELRVTYSLDGPARMGPVETATWNPLRRLWIDVAGEPLSPQMPPPSPALDTPPQRAQGVRVQGTRVPGERAVGSVSVGVKVSL